MCQPERINQYLGILSAQTARMTRLVDRILQFARMDSGAKIFIAWRPWIWFRWIPETTVTDFGIEGLHAQVPISFDAQPDVVLARADPVAIEEAVANLLENAMKYGDDHNEVHVSVQQRDGEILVAVRDRGIGVHTSDLPYIFDKFYRGQRGADHGRRGFGLGLTLVRSIARAHGGRVIVKTTFNSGSTFTLVIPAIPMETSRGASDTLDSEDEPEMRLMLRDNLKYEGYDVVTAETGELGLELGLSLRPDLILLDVKAFTRMTGYSVCQKLRSAGFDKPIIMITARNAEADRITGLDLGADDYIGKPFGVSELTARVRAHLRRAERPQSEPSRFVFGAVVLDAEHRQVFRDSMTVDLSSHEFDLLLFLIRSAGRVVSRDELLRDVWGYPQLPLTRTVDACVARLRSKVEEQPHQPRHIVTVHGIGYRFVK